MKKLVTILLIFGIITMSACGIDIGEKPTTVNIKIDESEVGTLVIEEHAWSDAGDRFINNDNTYRYENVKVGDNVYNGYATLEVKKVTPKLIVLSVDGGLVEPNKDGTVSLLAESLDKIKIDVGDEIEVVTQTMDAGARLKIRYEHNDNKDI